jgi:hypothetical protein
MSNLILFNSKNKIKAYSDMPSTFIKGTMKITAIKKTEESKKQTKNR